MRFIYTIVLTLIMYVPDSFSTIKVKTDEVVYTLTYTETKPTEITVVDNRIKVTNAPIGSKLEIYSVVGIKVREIEMKQSSGEYVVNIAKGYYIIRIDETVRKVAIR